MRGVFTIGVLDHLMEAGFTFDYGIGVSAGACHGLSFVSHQPGRAKKTSIDLLERLQYVGLKHLWKTHAIFNQEILYDRIPHEILPFDYAAAFANPMEFELVTTNCITGRAEYHSERHDRTRLITLCKASSSLPFVAPICVVDGVPMLDGGITDPIPVARAVERGYRQNVIVLTHPRGYRDGRDVRMPRFVYRSYPRLRVVLSRMNRVYNEHIALVERLEESGLALCIRPDADLDVDRLEQNTARLTALYDNGRRAAERLLDTAAARQFLRLH